jgi:prophage regulatory protein
MAHSTTAPNAGALTLERLPWVKARTGLSRSEIYRRVAAGSFPAPVKLGERASAWPASEVDGWIAARIAARDAKASA